MNKNNKIISLPKILGLITYDCLVVLTLLLTATTVLFILLTALGFNTPQPDSIYFRAYLFSVIISYYHICWAYIQNGQTIGMRAWNVSIINNSQNNSFTISQTILRVIGGIAGFLCFGLGYIWMYFNKEHKSWADYLSNSKLV